MGKKQKQQNDFKSLPQTQGQGGNQVNRSSQQNAIQESHQRLQNHQVPDLKPIQISQSTQNQEADNTNEYQVESQFIPRGKMASSKSQTSQSEKISKQTQRNQASGLSSDKPQQTTNHGVPLRSQIPESQSGSRLGEVTQQSFSAVFFTAFDYVLSDLRKKQKQFMIGVMTIFLVVGFVTFLDSLVQIAPAVFMMTAQTTNGDVDLKIGVLSQNERAILSNQNFFTQDIEQFNYKQSSEQEDQQSDTESQKQPIKLPFMNFTEVNQKISNSEIYAGAYPRWIALSKAINTQNRKKHTSAFCIIADTKLERDIGVASGFPNIVLQKNQVIAKQDLLHIMNLQEGDQIELNFDMFQMVGLDFTKLKRIVFDFDSLNSTKPQGQVLLEYFGLKNTQKVSPKNWLSKRMIKDFQKRYSSDYSEENQLAVIARTLLEKFEKNEQIGVHEIIEVVLKNIKEKDFVLKKNYTIVKGVQQSYGKWPSTYGNTLLIDSNFLLQDLAEMFKLNAQIFFQNNNYQESQFEVIDSLYEQLLTFMNQQNINEYAMNTMVLFKNRKTDYLQDSDHVKKLVNQIVKPLYKNTSSNFASYTTPILDSINQMKMITNLIENFFFMVVFFLCLISFILIFSLMQSDVEERTYEFAMLRTLGLRNSNLLVLLSIQAALFSIPGLILGFIINFILQNASQIILFHYAEYATQFSMKNRTVYIGLALGIFLPLISTIIPMKQALGNSLRNALDQFRSGIDEFEVKMVRMKSWGISIDQLIISLTLLLCGGMTYYYIPRAFLNNDLKFFSFLVNLLLVLLIIGLIMIAQTLVSTLERMLLNIIMFLVPSDIKMKPIVQKNLKSHATRNLKTSLMFTVTLSFLVFTTKIITGSDLTITKIMMEGTNESILDEFKLREFLDENTIERGGIIQSYTFQTMQLEKMIQVKGQGNMAPVLQYSGMGQRSQKAKLYSLDRNALDTLDREYFYPSEYIDDPMGTGQNYKPEEIFGMLYDIGDYSKYTQLYDEFDVITGDTNNETVMDSSIYNMISPEGLRGMLYEGAGEQGILCIGDGSEGTIGDITQKDKCVVKLRTKHVMTAIKFPGYHTFTAYAHAQYVPTMHLMSYPQMRRLVDEIFKRYPKREEAFKQKLLEIPKQSLDLPKNRLFMKALQNATRFERGVFMNNLLNFVKDETLLVFDRQSFIEDIDDRLILIDVFNASVSIICFALGLFQLIVSISANIRDSMWELGVLRAMGMNKNEIMRITMYESIVNNFSSIILGFVIGLIISTSLMAQFLLFLELPFELVLPSQTFIFLAILSIGTMTLGSYIGSRSLNKKQIASVLKGVS
eukprot:403349482